MGKYIKKTYYNIVSFRIKEGREGEGWGAIRRSDASTDKATKYTANQILGKNDNH